MASTFKEFCETVRTFAPPNSELPFSRCRWPYTYAYDMLRGYATQFGMPRINEGSRSAAAGWLTGQLPNAEQRNTIVLMLATAYCKQHHIDIPPNIEVADL